MSTGSFVRRPAVLLAFALCSVGGVVTLLGRLVSGPHVEQKRVALTNEAGAKTYPAFSPDGQRMSYSGRRAPADPFHLYVRTVAPDTPRQLTDGTGSDIGPAWSPDSNSIAFLRMEGDQAKYMIIPVNGGTERKVAEFPATWDDRQLGPSVAWTKDGKSLVVVAPAEGPMLALASVDVATGTTVRITKPPEGMEGDNSPAISPDGTSLAFVRHTGTDGADLYLCDLSGANPRRLTFDDRGIRGLSWTQDGHDLVYSATRVGGWKVWRVAAYGGSPRELPIAGDRAQFPAVAESGYHMAFADSPSVSAIWRAKLGSTGEASEDRSLIRSPGNEYSAVYSPDGTRIADISTQTGADEIWLSDAEGGNRVQLTHFKGPEMARLRWSPDGKTILFDVRGERGQDLYRIAAAADARPAKVINGAWNASWSHDGKRIYYDARGQLWKASADGTNPEVLVPEFGAVQGIESADGKYVYYRYRRSFWRIPVQGGQGEEIIVPEYDLPFATTLQPVAKGVYYSEFQRSTRSQVVSFYDFATRKSSVVFTIRTSNFFNQGHVYSISPDGKYIIYPRVDQTQTDLDLIENFR